MDVTLKIQNQVNSRPNIAPSRMKSRSSTPTDPESLNFGDRVISDDLKGTTLDLVCRHQFARTVPEKPQTRPTSAPPQAKVVATTPASGAPGQTDGLSVASNPNGTLTILQTSDDISEYRSSFANFTSEPDRRGLLEPQDLSDLKTNRARNYERGRWERLESRALDALTKAERVFKSHWRQKDGEDLIPERRDSVTLEGQRELNLEPVTQPVGGRSIENLKDIVSGDASFSEEGRLVRMDATLRDGLSGETIQIKLEPGYLGDNSERFENPGFRMQLEGQTKDRKPIELFLDSAQNHITSAKIPEDADDREPKTLLEGLRSSFDKRPSRWNCFQYPESGATRPGSKIYFL